jgi:hypothetical protein
MVYVPRHSRLPLLLWVGAVLGCGHPGQVKINVPRSASSLDTTPGTRVPGERLRTPIHGQRARDGGCHFTYYNLRGSYIHSLIQYNAANCTGVVALHDSAFNSSRTEVTSTRPQAPDSSLDADTRNFLEFSYKEIKDLGEKFLTVVVAVLVFSLTFSDKIVDFPRASSRIRLLLITSWAMFIAAIASCGLGLVLVFVAGVRAQNSAIGIDYQAWSVFGWWGVRAGWALLAAGSLFTLGLVLLISSGIASLRGSATRHDQSTPNLPAG